MIVDYIESHRDRFGLEPICAVLSEHGCPIAPSTYDQRRVQPVSAAEIEDAYLANALVTLWRENWGVHGARKLHRAAQIAGIDVGRDQVARLMRLAGIHGVADPPGPTGPRSSGRSPAVHWYNTRRIHSSIGYLPPVEYEQQHRQAQTITPATSSDPAAVNQPALR